MLDPLLTRLAVLGFGAIQALLTLRLVMSLADLPRAIMQFEPAVLGPERAAHRPVPALRGHAARHAGQ